MKFLNKRTGAVLDFPCRIEGPDWEEVTEAKKAEPEKAVKTPTKAAQKKKAVKKG